MNDLNYRETILEIDARQVYRMFANLSLKNQTKAHREALKKGSSILVTAARRNLRKELGTTATKKASKTGKSLQSGIRYWVGKQGNFAKVHIMGDYRLKWFEKGTDSRKTKNKGLNRGRISGRYFFKEAKSQTEAKVFNSITDYLKKAIIKLAQK